MKAVLKSDKERLELNLLIFFSDYSENILFLCCVHLHVFASVFASAGVCVSTEPEEAVDSLELE